MKKITSILILVLFALAQTSQFALAAETFTAAPSTSDLENSDDVEVIQNSDGTIIYKQKFRLYELVKIPTEWFEIKNLGYERPIIDASHIKSPSEISGDPKVIGTNALLAVIIFLVVGVACFLFNNVIEEHGDEINRFARKIPLVKMFERANTKKHSIKRKIFLLILLIAYGIIAAYITPDFSLFKQRNLGMVIVTVAAIIIGSYAKDMIRFFLARKWHWEAFFKPNVLGLFLAILCVIVSRNLNVPPGYLFGIPMGLFIISKKYEENEGKFEYYGLSWMFLMAIAAWVLAPYTTEYEVIHDLLNLLYIVLLEGVFFELFPLTYLPGGSIFKWSKIAWGSIFGAVSFLLLHSLFNPNSTFSTIAENPPTKNTLIILGIFVAISVLVWGVAKIKTKKA